MPYTQFTAAQVQYLCANYAELQPVHFAQQWDVPISSIYNLARRHQVKRRAPNGQPIWRGNVLAWASQTR
jgi:hypothetical protein